MTFVSYAQNFEDLILWRALKDVEKGFYIDLGAAWPSFHSVTLAFYERGWSGINVEPNPRLLKELNKERIRDTNLGVVIGDSKGEASLNILSNAGLSTASDEIAANHVEAGFEKQTVVAPMTTLTDLCDAHMGDVSDIHFLKIDVEGHEAQALRGNDWGRFRPWIILIEAMEPMSQVTNHHLWEHQLTEADYRYVYCDGLNRYYLAAEHYDRLVPAFAYPPNLFDDYMSVTQQTAMVEAEQRRNQIAELQQQITAAAIRERQMEAQNAELMNELSALRKHLEADAAYQASRGMMEVVFFKVSGEPKKFVANLLFHSSGRIRSIARRIVLERSGQPRPSFRKWMHSAAYQALSNAYRLPR